MEKNAYIKHEGLHQSEIETSVLPTRVDDF